MSFIRFGENGSGVYVYQGSVKGWGEVLICCTEVGGVTETAAEMIDHLRWHQRRGDVVPEYIFPGLADWHRDIPGAQLVELEDRIHEAGRAGAGEPVRSTQRHAPPRIQEEA